MALTESSASVPDCLTFDISRDLSGVVIVVFK